ncbi:MAG: 3'-5' exonuclease, partial [Oscillospiraceae bacterium]
TDSIYAHWEKNNWLDKYLPQIDSSHRIFPFCGDRKSDYVGKLTQSDILIDDYTVNLLDWQNNGGTGIKLLNAINNSKGTWQGIKISEQFAEKELMENLNKIVDKNDLKNTLLIRLQKEYDNLQSEFLNKNILSNISTNQIYYNDLYNNIYRVAKELLNNNSFTDEQISTLLKNENVIVNTAQAFEGGDGKTVDDAILYMANNTEEKISALIKIAEYEKKGFDFPNKDEYSDNHLQNLATALENYKNQGYSDESTVYLAKEKAKYLDIESMGINPSMNLDDIKSTVKKHAGIIPFEELITKDFVIIDTESTGYSNDDEIVELGVIDKNSNILFEGMFKPQKEITQEAFMVNGIHNSELDNKPTFSEQWKNIKQALEGKIIVTYNRDFDKRIMLQTCQKQGIDTKEIDKLFENSICAMQSYTEYKGHYKATKLNQALTDVGITKVQSHRAVDDCFDTLNIIEKCANINISPRITNIKNKISPFPKKQEISKVSQIKSAQTEENKFLVNNQQKEKSHGHSPAASFISY